MWAEKTNSGLRLASYTVQRTGQTSFASVETVPGLKQANCGHLEKRLQARREQSFCCEHVHSGAKRLCLTCLELGQLDK